MADVKNTESAVQDNSESAESQEIVVTNAETTEANDNSAYNNPAPCVYTSEPVIISQPADNSPDSVIVVEPGKTYIFDFAVGAIESTSQKDGDIVIKFANDTTITLKDFEAAFTAQFPPALTLADGTVVSALDLVETLTANNEKVEEEQKSEARKAAQVEPAAGDEPSAEELAQIETAAGEEGGAKNSGFGFQSSFAAGPIDPIDDVGPINPTLLQYGVEFRNDILFLEEQLPAGPDDQPIVVGPLTEFVDETNLGPLVETGQILADFGNDGPGTIGPNGSFVKGGSLPGGNLTSNGVAVVVTQTANGYEGSAGGIPVFTLVIDPATGNYTFTQLEQLDHADGSDPNDEITLQFGVVVRDEDGDTAETTITVTVADDAPVANDDFNMYNVADGGDNGNVITGLNGGPGAADVLSEDVDNTVIKVSFNGTTVDVPDGGSNVINGQFGKLEMFSNGSYTYTLFNPVPGTATTQALNPVLADTAGVDNSITKNGITVSSFQGDDLSWVDVGDGSGIGTGSSGGKVFGATDGLKIDFAQPATTAKITIGDIGSNNLKSGIDYTVYLSNGTSVKGEFDIGKTTVVNGVISFTLDGASFGPGLQITGIDLYSISNSNLGTASFALNNVEITHPGLECIEDQFTYILKDGDGDTDPALLTLKGKFPPVDARIEVNNGVDNVQVKEDGSVTVPVTASYTGGNGDEHLTLTLNGVNPAWGFSGTGWVATGTPGQYQLVLPAGQRNFSGTFKFTPPAQSDVDLNALSVAAIVSGPNPGDSDSASDSFNIIVDAVADKPSIVANDGTAEEGQPIPINIAGLLGVDNFDSSEVISGYQISGVPLTGFAFNKGTNLGGGVWSFTPAEISGLTLTPTNSNFFGSLNLTAKILTTENPVSDNEFDFTDNNNSATDEFCVAWKPDGSPVLVQPETVTVDETNLSPTTQVSDTIQANFGNDAPGSFSGTGTFSSAIPLTSNGVPVIVSFNAGTNTYTGTSGGNTVFTLAIQSDGDYTFTLRGVLDHPNASNPNDNIPVQFGIKATDSDGESTNGTITVNILDDAPKANDDCNRFDLQVVNKDFNIVLILDTSGSMAGDKLALLKSSVANLLGDFNAYDGGAIKVHIVSFSTTAGAGQSFTVTNDSQFMAAVNYINAFTANGYTNYEAALKSGINWLSGPNPLGGNAETITYFVSDGEPNRYLDNNGNVVNNNDAAISQAQYTGVADGTNEVAQIQALSDKVIGVGIGVNSTTLARLDVIDSNGDALDVKNSADLDAALQATIPFAGSASGNVITGENGGAGAVDDLSNDKPTLVTQVSFGGNTVAVPGVGVATINGTYGKLEISADGSYKYTVFASAMSPATVTKAFDIVPSDLGGVQNTFTKNGITVSSFLGDDLVWTDVGDGSGIGTGASGEKVFGATDGLGVQFAEPADSVTFTIGELGSNNLDDGIDWIAFLSNGMQVQGEFNIGTVTVVNGKASFTLDASDFGSGLGINHVELFSVQNSSVGTASWLLNNVVASYDKPQQTQDAFVYTVRDDDGDTSTAELILKGSSDDSVIASMPGAQHLYGTSSADTFLYDALTDRLDTIHDFDVNGGDVLDISALLGQYDPLQDSINDFVFKAESGGNTTISVDVNGAGNIANATSIAVIQGVTGLNLELVTNDGQAAVV